MTISKKKSKNIKPKGLREVPQAKKVITAMSQIKLPKIKLPLNKFSLRGIIASLAIAFFVIWIAIGLFVALLMVQGFRHGVFNSLLFSTPTTADTSPQTQAPTDANLPGVGRVNVSCVRQALSQESIQKLVEGGNTSVLSPDEKSKLEPCIVQKEEASPTSPSPAK